jgi:hypothetical protein
MMFFFTRSPYHEGLDGYYLNPTQLDMAAYTFRMLVVIFTFFNLVNMTKD